MQGRSSHDLPCIIGGCRCILTGTWRAADSEAHVAQKKSGGEKQWQEHDHQAGNQRFIGEHHVPPYWLVGSSVTSIVKTVPFLDFRIGRMGIGLNKAMFEFAQERAKKGQKAR